MGEPRNKLCKCGQEIFYLGAKTTQWGKNNFFNKECWENWMFTRKIRKHKITPYTKVTSKQIKELNVRPDTIKLVEENRGGKFHNIGHGNYILDMTTKHRQQKHKEVNGALSN